MRKQKNKGITLIALIITIIVLLILAGVTIATLTGNNGILTKATEAKESTMVAKEKEEIQIAYESVTISKLGGNITESELQNELDKNIPDKTIVTENEDGTLNVLFKDTENSYNVDNGKIEEELPVTNPYGEDEWIMAWTCTNGIWSDTIQAGNIAEGDIVAKLYSTGNRITPDGFTWSDIDKTFMFNEGDEYKLVIEGQGKMGVLMTSEGTNITSAAAWHVSTAQYIMGLSDTCIMPYISEIIICDGITGIGDFAFAGDTSLTKITMPKDIEEIGMLAFMYNINLSSIRLPISLTSIGRATFYGCSNLESITIPSNVIHIDSDIFWECDSLKKIRILITDSNNLTINSDAFRGIFVVIYVQNEDMKTMLDEMFLGDLTVQVEE